MYIHDPDKPGIVLPVLVTALLVAAGAVAELTFAEQHHAGTRFIELGALYLCMKYCEGVRHYYAIQFYPTGQRLSIACMLGYVLRIWFAVKVICLIANL